MVFRSAVDRWYYAVAIGLPVVLLHRTYRALETGNATVMAIVVCAILPAAALPIWLLLATNYRVESGNLRVRCGPFSWTIPLDQIESVQPSRSVLSSPALSLDRLRIRYGNGRSVLVSPRDKEAFLAAIGQSGTDSTQDSS